MQQNDVFNNIERNKIIYRERNMTDITTESIEKQLCSDIAIITSNDEKTIDCNESLASLGIDSLSLVEIFIAVENNFKIKLLNSNLTNNDLLSIHSLSNKIYSILND
jgi:acyl carrier protein